MNQQKIEKRYTTAVTSCADEESWHYFQANVIKYKTTGECYQMHIHPLDAAYMHALLLIWIVMSCSSSTELKQFEIFSPNSWLEPSKIHSSSGMFFLESLNLYQLSIFPRCHDMQLTQNCNVQHYRKSYVCPSVSLQKLKQVRVFWNPWWFQSRTFSSFWSMKHNRCWKAIQKRALIFCHHYLFIINVLLL